MIPRLRVVTVLSGAVISTDYHDADYHQKDGFLVITHTDKDPKAKVPNAKLLSRVPMGNINQVLELLPVAS